jgi:hypothetical protein
MTLITTNKLVNFAKIFGENKRTEMIAKWYILGGITVKKGEYDNWMWESTGEQVSFVIPFAKNEPTNIGGDENCLAMHYEKDRDLVLFADINCIKLIFHFLCEEMK